MRVRIGQTFVRVVRTHPPDLFDAYGFVVIGHESDSLYGSVVARNESHYLRVTLDPRERVISANLGRLVEGLVPPVSIVPPKTVERVTEIPSIVILWLATGNLYESDELGRFREDSEEAISAAVGRLMDALARHGARLLAGDPVEWGRAAELYVTGTPRP